MISILLRPLEIIATCVLTAMIIAAAIIREAIGNRWNGP
jgi:hypothetical protein